MYPLDEGANFTNSTIEQIKEEGSSYGVSESEGESTVKLVLLWISGTDVGDGTCELKVKVEKDGAPLEGAIVHYINDDDLTPEVESYTVTTDSNGYATFTADKDSEIYAEKNSASSDKYKVTIDCGLLELAETTTSSSSP
jgi:hypothetical protein